MLAVAGAVLAICTIVFGRHGAGTSVWVPDVAVGAVYVAAGVVTIGRSRTIGALLGLTGCSWFVDTLTGWFEFLHRGPLVHVMLIVSAGRRVGRVRAATVAVGYLAAVYWPLWSRPAVAAGSAAVLVVAGVIAPDRLRAGRERWLACAPLVSFASIVVVSALVLGHGGATWRDPIVHAYELVMVVIAGVVVARLVLRPGTAVSDLVIELGEPRSTTLRDAFADVLGDPTLQLGYWTPEPGAGSGRYLAADGTEIAVPDVGSSRRATFIDRDGTPIAVLVHDAAALEDPAVVAGVATATRLQDDNVTLEAELRQHLDELSASRRRLVVAADRARQRLQQRLDSGAGRRVALVEEEARSLLDRGSVDLGHLRLAVDQLVCTRDDLELLGRGLHPRRLDQGLHAAVACLAAEAAMPVRIDDRLVGPDLHGEVAVTAYYVCAEALTNTVKHARARSATIELAHIADGVRISVVDDGVGGADVDGSGLRGLADRVAAFGGRFTVSSTAYGTTVRADLPTAGAVS